MIVTLFTVPALAFFRERPPTPPSVVADDTNAGMKFIEASKALFTNRNYVLLFIVFNLIFGVMSALGAIFANLCLVNNYSLNIVILSLIHI